MPTLGPGIDGFIQEMPTASLGPGIAGFIKAIPSASMGPGIDGFIQIAPLSSLGPGIDDFADFLVASSGPVYNMPITAFRERNISATYSLILNEFRERSQGTNYAFEISELFEGLLRSKQITERDIDVDRLVDLPVQILSSRFGVNMTTTMISELLVVPTGKTAIVLGIMFEATVADTVTGLPAVSLGIASGEDDIFDQEIMQSFNVVGDTWSNWLSYSHGRAAATGESIKVSITGATATTLISNIHLIGFLI
jgi:hypothetical protein